MKKLFIIGHTKSGKTRLAKILRPKGNFISASDWVRNTFRKQKENENYSDFVKEISQYSISKLKSDIDICVNTINERINETQIPSVIEGIRNPLDFSKLYKPGDKVILLDDQSSNVQSSSDFEFYGILSIKSILGFLKQNKITNSSDVLNIFIHQIDSCKKSHWIISNSYCCFECLEKEIIKLDFVKEFLDA